MRQTPRYSARYLGEVTAQPAAHRIALGLPSQAMRRALILTTILLLATTACSGGDDDTPEAEGDTIAQAEQAAGIPPEPDQATADAYIAALDAINPAIVHRSGGQDEPGDIDAAIDRGRDLCSTLANTTDPIAQTEAVNQRITSPDAPEGWGPEIAQRILPVVRHYLCPE